MFITCGMGRVRVGSVTAFIGQLRLSGDRVENKGRSALRRDRLTPPILGGAAAQWPSVAATYRQVFIQGVTQAGRSFRPSDWAERLAGAMSSFRPGGAHGGAGAHIGYSPYCFPQLIDGVKCVIVNEALRELEPMAWDFVMNFARDNELCVLEAQSPAAENAKGP